jgi:hypothetical protein
MNSITHVHLANNWLTPIHVVMHIIVIVGIMCAVISEYMSHRMRTNEIGLFRLSCRIKSTLNILII